MISKFLLCLFLAIHLPARGSSRIIGEGDYQFEFLPDGISLPQSHQDHVQDYHGVAVDSTGRVYIAYYSSKHTDATRTVARFLYTPTEETPFTFDRFLGDASWVAGRVHGLNIIKTDQGEERLLLVYNSQKVILCDLDGNVDKTDSWIVKHAQFGKASDGNRSPLSTHLGVYDGYKSNLLHPLHIHDGSRTGHQHGGRGKGLGKTDTAHGIGVDLEGRYVVADRGNMRLVWRNPEFQPLNSEREPGKQLQLATPGLEVCNVQFAPDGSAVLPALNAKIGFLKKSDESECGYVMDGSITMPADLVKLGYDGIHDVNFSVDKKFLIVAVWQRDRATPPRLFALKRIER
jgi:hypothetical protein